MTNQYPQTIFTSYLDKLRANIDGMGASSDIEYLHQARVASRRLRTALWAFEKYLPEKLKSLRKGLKKFTKALGEARDLDIQSIFLKNIQSETQSVKVINGLKEISSGLDKKRQLKQKKITGVLNTLTAENTLKKLEKHIPEIKVKTEFKKLAVKQIKKQLAEIDALAKFAYRPKAVKQLHKLRIAAKHLRYTLELFSPVFPEKLEKYIETVHTIQNFLGETHDMDIWLENLPELTKKHSSLASAADFLKTSCQTKRQNAYNNFLACWKKTEKEKTWKKLLSAISNPRG